MPRSVQAFVGINVDTTAIKAVLVSQSGTITTESEVEQPISTPRPGWTEQRPEMWWDSTVSAVQNIVKKTRPISVTPR